MAKQAIIATFSDGTVDQYKGARAVRAAWQVKLPTGKVVSGHSLSRENAEKTARATISQLCTIESVPRGSLTHGQAVYLHKVAKQAGFRSVREYAESQAAKRAEFAAACKVEIVDC